MATPTDPPPPLSEGGEVTTISATGEMREATPEEAEAFTARMQAASAERERRDGFDAATEPLDDPRVDEPPAPAAESGLPPERMKLSEAIALARSDAAREILDAAGKRAIRRDGEIAASVGLIFILQAAMEVGRLMQPDTESSPRWLVDFAIEQGLSPRQLESYGGTPGPVMFKEEVRLRTAATKAVQMARDLASATIGESRFDARHLILAALDAPDGETREQVQRNFIAAGLDLHAFRGVLLRRVLESPAQGEDVGVWQRLLDDPGSAWRSILSAGTALPARTAGTVVNLNADRTAADGADPLGIQADVTAFARLICLEEARPPLSIGIFGEWGSGKSSFMERLQREIADLTRKEREARARRGQADAATASGNAQASASEAKQATAPRFIENVVQIRFNAWHYADANLWASLTAEFFDQLRRGGYEGQRSSDYLALIGKVAERVRSLEASAQKAEDKLADAERAARHADEALASAREKLAASDLALASEQLAKTLDGIRNEKQNADKLKEVGRRIYRDDLGADLDSFTAAVAEASTIPGKITLVARVMAGGGLPTWLGALAIVLVAAAGVGWRLGEPTSLAVLLQRAIAWGGGTLAALGSLWQAVKLAKPVLDGAWAYAKTVEKARKELAKEVEDREVAARDASRALAEAQQKAKEAKAPLANYGDGAAAGAPSTILRYFLFEDGDVRDYDKQVGLVSRARRSFEQLDAIFTARRDGHAASDKKARGETLTPAEAEALKRYEAMRLDGQGLAIPDRIVLYIDDLDRCTHEQVYDVLQAIHLLLAFELFVVVVGVDVRWVEEAVARQFTDAAENVPESATQAEREAARHKAETGRRKRAIDYLEKIFQLPFWLRRLSTEGEKGGSYGAYVQELLRANLDVPENVSSPLAGTSGGPVLKGLVPGVTPDAAARTTDDARPESLADAAPAADDLASVDQALATVRLTREEVDFLASPEIGAIAFKSPRSVKRMLNVYRIVRARMSETELDAFLGRNGKLPTWPLAAFCAALETGQPSEVADAFNLGWGNEKLDELFSKNVESIRDHNKLSPAEKLAFETMRDLEATTKEALGLAMKTAFKMHLRTEVIKDFPSQSVMLAMARIVRRYSFNRYH